MTFFPERTGPAGAAGAAGAGEASGAVSFLPPAQRAVEKAVSIRKKHHTFFIFVFSYFLVLQGILYYIKQIGIVKINLKKY
jgi:hypothetical protein